MRTTVVGLVLMVFIGLVSPHIVCAQPPRKDQKKGKRTARSLEGIYYVKGTLTFPDGKKPYLGTAIIIAKKGTYQIQWQIGSDRFVGVGIHKGDYMGATWAVVRNGNLAAGTLMFKVERGTKGPRLVGTWTGLPGDGTIHEEILTFVEPLSDKLKKKKKKQIDT